VDSSDHDDHDQHDGFEGEVTLAVDGATTAAAAVLAARFDPLGGRVVWSGRVRAELPLRRPVVVTTPHGTARAETTEHDAWGNTRLAGAGRPPFPVELLDRAGET
jgi:hypothetical protein